MSLDFVGEAAHCPGWPTVFSWTSPGIISRPTGIHACSEERPGREAAIMHLAGKKRGTIDRFGRNFVQR
jgi:hypothetical protein